MMSLTGSMRVVDAPNDNSFWNDDSDKDSAPKICAEPGCMNPVGTTPTGRKAKYCDDHKSAANRSGTASKTARPRKRSSWPEKESVRQSLLTLTSFAGAGLSVINKFDGKVVRDGGPNVVNALVDLAEDDKRLRRYLNMFTGPGKYGPLVLATLGVVIPIMANHNLLPTFFVDLSGSETVGANIYGNGGESE